MIQLKELVFLLIECYLEFRRLGESRWTSWGYTIRWAEDMIYLQIGLDAQKQNNLNRNK